MEAIDGSAVPIPILYEDAWMLAVNKPPGIVVNDAATVSGSTVQSWAAARFGAWVQTSTDETLVDPSHYALAPSHCDFCARAGIVHRIDRETSGILLIAKTPHAFTTLQLQFKERQINKEYLAIAHGLMESRVGEIRAPVGRLPWNRERFGVVPGGKEAITFFRVISHLQKHSEPDAYSLISLSPKTGRTHQIRVHLKYIQHPILGDYLYAGRKVSRDDRVSVPRVMLHAWKLSLTHPQTQQKLDIVAPVPNDMIDILHRFEVSIPK